MSDATRSETEAEKARRVAHELLDAYLNVPCGDVDNLNGKWPTFEIAALNARELKNRDEIISLSAGNPQAEKVTCAHAEQGSGNVCQDCASALRSEPERRDGRISTPLGPMTIAECVREGERSETRIQGESCPPHGVDDGPCAECEIAETQRSVGRIEALRDRSDEALDHARRIEAGSEQEPV